MEFAEQAQVSVLFERKLVGPHYTNEVRGDYSVEDALLVLLTETGLKGRLTETGTLIIGRCENCVDVEGNNGMKTNNKRGTLRAALLTSAAAFASILPSGASAQDAAAATSTEDILIVTGVRGEPRSVIDSPIPIDVFSSEMLERIPGTGGLFEQLRYNVPSLNLPQRAGGGTATFIASAGLRALNPDQTLVLVNGKRRHKTSLINTSTGLFSGSAGVDLNMIPNSAIDRVEVLRDGAAAQYGSDAIAGVVNIILKEAPEGGFLTATRGQNFDRNDGEFFNFGANGGFALGDNGFVNVSFDYRQNEGSERASPVPIPTEPGASFRFFPDVDNMDGTFSVDPREALVNRTVRNFGEYPSERYSFAINAAYDFGDVEAYSFATYTDRSSTLFFTFRRPRDGRNNGEIFPNGFIPEEEIREDDFEVVAGLRGTTAGFDWDLSGGYGRNIA
ncbi:TonB-dependent receptor, partial [Leptolyngbya cf. ectocarpi LEGE 11479]